MDFQGIYDRLRAVRAPGMGEVDEARLPNPEDKKDKGRAGDSFLHVEPAQIVAFMELCRDDPRLQFEMLVDMTATDPAVDDENLWVNYQLLSVAHRHRFAIKCLVPKSAPAIDTLVPVYRSAQWLEREAAEMFGIKFRGHPDPRNILLPDDWIGYPLRKDYEFPKEYHGISCE